MLHPLLLLVLASPPAKPANLQAAFAVEAGFVQLRLTQDDRPVGSAKIRVYDLSEQPFAEGETDDEGLGTFPVPKRQPFYLGITINGKECDLITLRVHDKSRAEPDRVLLSFGTRPCCRSVTRSGVAAGDAFPEDDQEPEGLARALVPVGLGVGFVVLAGLTLVLFRSKPTPRS